MNNKKYFSSQKSFFTGLRGGNTEAVQEPPLKADVEEYWGGLFGKVGTHNKNAAWLKTERFRMRDGQKAVWTDISILDLRVALRKLSNWKAPGRDQVQNFWLKNFTALHPLLVDTLNFLSKEPERAPPLVDGRTNYPYL